MYQCAICMQCLPKQEEDIESLGLEVQTVVSHH